MVEAELVAEVAGVTVERLETIKRNWIGNGYGLAITGNESHRQIAELIQAVEGHKRDMPILIVAMSVITGFVMGLLFSLVLIRHVVQ